jgi:pyruvate formate lyase activating enzyme
VEGRIHSIETFGTVDGPGIRFVIFLQGCPMRCAYCHNPDTWEINGGSTRSVSEILKEYDSYKTFLKGGGITVSGGEPLVQIDFVTELFYEAKKKGIHTCLDTSGITYQEELSEKYLQLLNSTDLVMLDIKHIDSKQHRKLTGHTNERILEFAKFICKQGVDLWIRFVAVPTLTDNEEDLIKLGEFLAELTTLKALDVLPYHTMGISKYEELQLEYPLRGIEPMEKEKAREIRDIILRARKRKLDT